MVEPWQTRPVEAQDLAPLSALCLRSKAVWGYDEAFIEACREELTFTEQDLAETVITLAERSGELAGVVQLEVSEGVADLLKLYVEPTMIGGGLGRLLFDWAVAEAKRQGARSMTIEADPHAKPIYEKMGAVLIGTAPSGSIPGRELPLLRLEFRD